MITPTRPARPLKRGIKRLAAGLLLLLSGAQVALPQGRIADSKMVPKQCRRAVLEGTVHSGQAFQVEFAQGLLIGLEPLPSGWALRVISSTKLRGPHDFAEVATLPYASVSPLLLSTDWAFRAQDAAGWTPRRFHYAASEQAYATLAAGYDAVVRGEPAASQRAAVLSEVQPEGLLEIEDVRLAPGLANQTSMAAAVSTRFTETPHTLDMSVRPTPLGRLEEVRFRISLDLPVDLVPAKGIRLASFRCAAQPTAAEVPASQPVSKRNSR